MREYKMPTRNINLTEHYDRFIEKQIASGQFKNASEVTRAGLRLLEQHSLEEQEKLAALRALAAKGFDELDQGRGIVLAGRDQLADFIAQVGRRVSARARSSKDDTSMGRTPTQYSKGKNPKSSNPSSGPRSAKSN
jgi:antitoxin ParD1/3/4